MSVFQHKSKLSFCLTVLSFSVMLLQSCDPSNSTDEKKTKSNKTIDSPTANYQSKLDIKAPAVGQSVRFGDSVKVETMLAPGAVVDSIQYRVNRQLVNVKNAYIPAHVFRAGRNDIDLTAYGKGFKEQLNTHVQVNTSKAPNVIKPKIVKTFAHDTKAYTQGLFWHQGYLYEGTGQFGESMLRKVNLVQNKVLQSVDLPGNVFGEGIALYNDKIYQLTWQSHKAYVYDAKTFALKKELEYPTEGWGICNYGNQLIMSDGTQNLYVLEPENFSFVDQFQVYDHVGPINQINELEWIEGKIWANVYLTNFILIIDPKTGFVESKIDMSALIPSTYANSNDNVLNGIAYDAQTKRIFVTGKRWPVIYQIAL